MTKKLQIPELGEGNNEGLVTSISVKPGDVVKAGDTLLEIETDKVVIEVPAEFGGQIVDIFISEGQSITQGIDYLSIIPALESAELKTDPPKSTTESTVTNAEENAVERSVERALESPAKKPIKNTVVENTVTNIQVATTAIQTNEVIHAGPASRRLARQLGLSLVNVNGSGHHGRISKMDVKAYVKNHFANKAPVEQAVEVPDVSLHGPVTIKPLTPIQRSTARNMKRATTEIPHAWIQTEIDITTLEEGRKRNKALVAERGGTLTLTAILCKVVANAVAEHPQFNSVFDNKNDQLIYRDYVNIGVAVDTDRGLLVPSIKQADKMSILDLSIALKDISNRAKDHKITAKELQGTGITLSNLGGMGVTNIFPIVNWPEVAILGIATSELKPKWLNNQFTPRLIMPITLGFDHRVINGADGARFLATIKELIENPMRDTLLD